MMKRRFGFILVLLFICTMMIPSVHAESETLGDLKTTYQNKLNEKAEYEAKSAAAKKEIAENKAALAKAEADIHKAEEDMHAAQEAIDESNEKIKKLSAEAEKLLLYLQQIQGENAYIEYVSGASSMTDLVTRIAAIEQLTNHIQTTMGNLEVEIKKNEDLKKELEARKAELEKKSVEYEATIKARTADAASYDKYALGYDEQIKSAKDRLDTYTTLCAKFAPEKGDSAIINEDCLEKKYDDNGNIISINNSTWYKPLPYGIIMSEVGARWGSYHNALDISGNSPFEGTPVYSAAYGVVSGKISRYSCGGNMLYIDVVMNGEKFTTYYYHLLRFNVDIGDVVTPNTVIGWVGGYSTSTSHGGYDGCTTGAHLHYGVAKGFYNGYSIPRSNVIVPPGFPNQYGWRFYSRTQMY